MEIPYIRVGVTYYKLVDKPLASGDAIRIRQPWNSQTIRLDHGEKYLKKVPNYDGLCTIPNHIDYHRVIKNHWNVYEPLPISPNQGDYQVTYEFMNHIFGDQLLIGLDYLTILYRFPQRLLPILCLVSKERKTGKTTFLNYLKVLFGHNMTQNTNDDFRSNFNSEWASKLIVAIDEVLLDKREDSEKIKHLSTARLFKSEAKGKDRNEVEFFGKFILCSNDEEGFIKVDEREIRYWVVKVSPLISEDVDLLKKLQIEAPAFLHLLKTREIISPEKTRMWFTESQIRTKALMALIRNNTPKLEMELMHIFQEVFEKYELDEFNFCISDLIPFLRFNSLKGDRNEIRKLVKKWELNVQPNSYTYTRIAISSDGTFYMIPGAKGRFFTITKDKLDELMNGKSNHL